MLERREHERRALCLPVRIYATPDEKGPRVSFGTSVNVSTGGALIETTPFPEANVGKSVQLTMMNVKQEGPFNPVVLSWSAEIIRADAANPKFVAVRFKAPPQIA